MPSHFRERLPRDDLGSQAKPTTEPEHRVEDVGQRRRPAQSRIFPKFDRLRECFGLLDRRSFAGRRKSQKRLSISPNKVAAGHDCEKRVVVDNSRFRAEGWIVQPWQDRSYPGCDRLIDDL